MMRILAVLCAFAAAAPAGAQPLPCPALPLYSTTTAWAVPALSLDATALFDAAAVVASARSRHWSAAEPSSTPSSPSPLPSAGPHVLDAEARARLLQLPDHYAWVERDTRAFWYASGIGAAATLATHVFVGLPALVLGSSVLAALGAGAPAGVLALGLGGATAYFAAESLLSALAAKLVFDATSETYDANYVTALGAHFVGNLLSTGATVLTFGGGLLLLHGTSLLAEFTSGGGLTALQLFSVLGAMPGVVIAGIALVVVPALVTSWAMAVTATPKPGFAIDDDWRSPSARIVEPLVDERRVAATAPLIRFALPSPWP